MAASTPTEVSTSQTRSSYDYNDLWCRSHFSACSSGMATSTNSERYDFITFLEVCQNLEIDFLPITWQPALDRLGIGAQSEVLQSQVNLGLSFAFNRVKIPTCLSWEEEDAVYRALVSQASVLGHCEIRSHSNINNLVGVCWDVRPGEDIQSQGYIQPLRDVLSRDDIEAQPDTPSSKWKVWPVLVFEKSKHGDLDCFMRSVSGSNLDITGRLKLCVNIASGIQSLHDNCIIHGDIKPHNVLIFEERPGLYTAKLSDLGHSIPFCNDDDRVPMASTRPWQAPEHNHRETYQLSDMISMEVYSFGMVCLWLLFHERLFKLGITFNLRGMEEKGLDRLNALKNEWDMSEIAQSLTWELEWLPVNQILNLTRFFQSCLAPNNIDRGSDISYLLQLLSDSSTISMALVSTATATKTLSNEPHKHKHFQISESAWDFYDGDYRVRIHITSCLRERLSHLATEDTSDKLQSQQAAFQLALCFRLGFGVIPDDEEVQKMLQRSARPIQDLDKEMLSIKHGNFRGQNNYYASLSEKGFSARTDYGYYYYKSGVLDEAKAELQKEMINLNQVFQDSEGIANIVRCTLVNIFRFQGQWKEVERLVMQVIETEKRVHGEEHQLTLTSMGGLASTYQRQGRSTEAEELEMQVIEIQKRVLGEEHPDTLNNMANLSTIYHSQGRWTEAEELDLQVIETEKRVLGEEHPDTLISMINLASTYQEQRRWTEAEELQMHVIETEKRVLGEEHPDTLISMTNLATIYQHQERWTEAEILEVQVIKLSLDMLGEEHPDTLSSMINLASTYRHQRRWSEAERLQMQVMKINSRVLEEEHSDTLTSMNNLASIYHSQGRWIEAEELNVQVIKTRKRVLGEEHSDTLISIANLALTYWNQGRWIEAEELNMQVMKTRKRVLGEEHPDTLISMNNLVHMYNEQGRHKEAAALMRNVIQLHTAALNRAQRAGAQAIISSPQTVATAIAEAEASIHTVRELHRERVTKVWRRTARSLASFRKHSMAASLDLAQ